jgi:hypothetical protein
MTSLNRWPDDEPRPVIYEPKTSLMQDWRNLQVVRMPKQSKTDRQINWLMFVSACALLFAYLLQWVGAK